jgi:hypothetical protein
MQLLLSRATDGSLGDEHPTGPHTTFCWDICRQVNPVKKEPFDTDKKYTFGGSYFANTT